MPWRTGFPDDRALDPQVDELAQHAEVVQRRHAAAGDHRPVGRRAHRLQQLDVGPGEGAVAVDVGDDVSGAAVGVEAGERLEQLAAVLGPAAGGERRAADVEPDGDPVAHPGDRRAHPVRVLERCGAEIDAGAAGGERGVERGVVADAARQLDCDVELADDRRDQLAVAAAAERRVEVDQMHPLGTRLLPGAARRRAGRRTPSRCRPRP
jgi:hypothetical protein